MVAQLQWLPGWSLECGNVLQMSCLSVSVYGHKMKVKDATMHTNCLLPASSMQTDAAMLCVACVCPLQDQLSGALSQLSCTQAEGAALQDELSALGEDMQALVRENQVHMAAGSHKPCVC